MYFFYFYPVGLDQKRRRLPLLTILLILCMTGGLIWLRYFPYLITFHPARLIFYPGNEAPWTVVAAVFLHGGWMHFLGNAVYLAVFAPLLEDRFGRLRLLYYFLLLGCAGNLLHGVFALRGWLGQNALGVIGASGAIAGLLAITLVRFYYARVELAFWVFTPLQGVNKAGRAYLPVPAAAALWILLQVGQGLVAPESGAMVAYGAHLGGFVFGLLLALLLGYPRQARADSRMARGRRYLQKGQAFAAEGAFREFLAMAPEDRTGLLQLARAQRLTGQIGAARQVYCRVFRRDIGEGRIPDALAVYEEAKRGSAALSLPAAELAKAAFYLEKKLDFAGAVEAYVDLHHHFPADEKADLALVRAIMLTKTKLGQPSQTRRLLQTARRELPSGVWRDFLASEFNLDRTPREEPPEAWPNQTPEPAL